MLTLFDPRNLWTPKIEPEPLLLPPAPRYGSQSTYHPRKLSYSPNSSPYNSPPPSPIKGASQRLQHLQQLPLDPLDKITYRKIMESSKLYEALHIRQSIINYISYTYQMINPHLDKSKSDSIDGFIETLPKVTSINMETLNILNNNIEKLDGNLTGYTSEECEKMKLLIYCNKKFADIKANTQFPICNKICLFGWTCTVLSNILVNTSIINDPQYFFDSATYTVLFTIPYVAYRLFWSKCVYQNTLTSKAEELRDIAKQVFSMIPNHNNV